MRRYLTQAEAVSALRRGKAVEQLLESAAHDGRATLRWLSVFAFDGAFVVNAHHVYDPCDPDFIDVTEFEPVDGDEATGEGVETWLLP